MFIISSQWIGKWFQDSGFDPSPKSMMLAWNCHVSSLDCFLAFQKTCKTTWKLWNVGRLDNWKLKAHLALAFRSNERSTIMEEKAMIFMALGCSSHLPSSPENLCLVQIKFPFKRVPFSANIPSFSGGCKCCYDSIIVHHLPRFKVYKSFSRRLCLIGRNLEKFTGSPFV